MFILSIIVQLGNLLSFCSDVAQGRMNGAPMRLELTREGLLV